jgi:hypothetical protein
VDFQTQRARCLTQVTRLIAEERVVGVEQDGDQIDLGNEFVKQAEPLRFHLVGKETHPRKIPTGAVETSHETRFDRVRADREHDWNG